MRSSVSADNIAAPVLPTVASSTQFDVTGFLQSATLDTPGDTHSGGTLMVNGHSIVVPRETIVILPANALTWQELFTHAPAPYAPTQTGMALKDTPAPLTTYEVHVVGNRVINATGDRYIAGLVDVSQQDLNSGAGYINYMNYTTGEMEVGGTLGVSGTGTRVQINDPANATALDENGVAGSGRYGRAMTPDDRFQVDQDNPTIIAATGYPMCFPRVTADPNIPGNADDPQCPVANRPIYRGVDTSGIVPQAALPLAGQFYSLFRMPAPGGGVGSPDPTLQAPMEIGDYITYAGTLIQDGGANGGRYISAHTITDNTGIYTQPGIDPAYVMVEVSLLGTGGLTVFGAGEATIRTRFEGMTTDESRQVHLYGIDINPITGATSDRDWGTIQPDLGPPTGAVRGRWRFRPPCTVPVSTTKACSPPATGEFIPPTREVRAVIEGHQQFLPGTNVANPASQVPGTPTATTTANGIYWSQYHAPIGEYIFPENVPGTAVPENNFNTIPFLASGGYQSITGVQAGVLNPWPSNIAPAPPCQAPVANAGGPYTVASGATVTLAGSSTGTTPSFLWAVPLKGTLSSTTTATPVYTAPAVATDTTVNLSLAASNACGTNTATTTVTVRAALAPKVDPIGAQTVVSGGPGSFAVTGSDPNVPTAAPLTFSVTQTGTPALINLKVTQNGPTAANIDYTSKAGVATPTLITLTVTAKNTALVSSAPVTTTVTINPDPNGVAPVANAGGPYTVSSGGQLTLAGSATGTSPFTFSWAVPAKGSLAGSNTATAVYTAPVVAVDTVVNLSFTVTNKAGTSTATATVTVKAALPPTVNPVAPISVLSGANGSLAVTGLDSNIPALTPLTFRVTQTGAVLTNVVVTRTSNTSASVTFTAPTLVLGQVAPAVSQLTITATNSLNLVSASQLTSVTVNPIPDLVAITTADYRTAKQRLLITATSSVVSANVVLKLQPYLTIGGITFNPAVLGDTLTNTGGGLYTMDLVGAPQPAAGLVLTVKSNLNGLSPAHALDTIRQ